MSARRVQDRPAASRVCPSAHTRSAWTSFIMPEIGHLYKTPAHVPILFRLPLRLLPGAGRERPRDRPMHDECRDQPVPQCYGNVMVMTLLNCPALGCRARRLDDGESDNADKPGASAKNQFRVASRTQDRDEVMASQTETRGLTRDRLAGCPPVHTSAEWKAFRPWTSWVACTTSATFSRATSRP